MADNIIKVEEIKNPKVKRLDISPEDKLREGMFRLFEKYYRQSLRKKVSGNIK